MKPLFHWIAGLTLMALLVVFSRSAAFGQLPASPIGVPDEDPWPRIFDFQGSTLKVYQPQIHTWTNNLLDAYCAVAVKNQASGKTDYGVIWFSARTEVDKVNRLVTLEDLQLTKQSFPSLPNNGTQFNGVLIGNMQGPHSIPLDLLQSDLALTNAAAKQKAYTLLNEPPTIIVSFTPAVLALIIGQPVLSARGRESPEGAQFAHDGSLRPLQEYVLPGADGRLGASRLGSRAVGQGGA